MRYRSLHSRHIKPLLFGSLAMGAAIGIVVAVGARVSAQDEAPADKATHTAAKRKPHVASKSPAPAQEAAGTTAKDAPAAPSGASPNKPTFDFAAQLDRAGASGCRSQLNALASSTMESVEAFNTMSSWSQAAGDKRAVSIAIGQKYASGSAVPFGVSEIIAAPNQKGSCDGLTIQVVPSPLSCSKLRDSMTARRGRQIADLSGIPLVEEADLRTMLVPTGNNTCVLVATRIAYAK